MNKFENVDVLAALKQLMQQNTAFYRNDFEIDKEAIRQADDRPAGFRGHSLSVSDVIVINRGGKEDAHYSGLRCEADRQGGRKDTGQSL